MKKELRFIFKFKKLPQNLKFVIKKPTKKILFFLKIKKIQVL